MKRIVETLQARDIVAFLLIIGIVILIAMGYNSYLYPLLTLIVGYYFSKRVYEENGRSK